ncbi:hypothetical protein ACFW04_002392 [Cataglyphis niger]
MLRLIIISMLAGIATVHCGSILTPVIGKLVSERVIESHGNNVVHASAPTLLVAAASPTLLRYPTNVALVQEPVAEIVQPLAKATLVAERTIEAHGHHIIHNTHPVPVTAKLLPAIKTISYFADSSHPHQIIDEKLSPIQQV